MSYRLRTLALTIDIDLMMVAHGTYPGLRPAIAAPGELSRAVECRGNEFVGHQAGQSPREFDNIFVGAPAMLATAVLAHAERGMRTALPVDDKLDGLAFDTHNDLLDQRANDLFLGGGRRARTSPGAFKVGGERLYRKARRGESAEIPWRSVVIHSLERLAWEWPRLTLRIRCGKGTYIRSLAADLGEALGCGAYVGSLRRTASGCYSIDQALSLEQLEALAARSQAEESA